MEEKAISKAVISRLPRYYRYLGAFDGEWRGAPFLVKQADKKMCVTAPQMQQDFE